MLVLIVIVCLVFFLSAAVRWSGASRWIAVGLPTLPALVAFIYYAIRHDIELGPHGGIVPAWIIAGIVLLVVVAISFIATRLVKDKGS